jgi:hypothetical protein
MRHLIESMTELSEGLSLGRKPPTGPEAKAAGLSPLLRGPKPAAKVETVLVDPERELAEAASSIKITGEDAAMMAALMLFLVKQDKGVITYASVLDKFVQHIPGLNPQVARTVARATTDYYTEMLGNDE